MVCSTCSQHNSVLHVLYIVMTYLTCIAAMHSLHTPIMPIISVVIITTNKQTTLIQYSENNEKNTKLDVCTDNQANTWFSKQTCIYRHRTDRQHRLVLCLSAKYYPSWTVMMRSMMCILNELVILLTNINASSSLSSLVIKNNNYQVDV